MRLKFSTEAVDNFGDTNWVHGAKSRKQGVFVNLVTF